MIACCAGDIIAPPQRNIAACETPIRRPFTMSARLASEQRCGGHIHPPHRQCKNDGDDQCPPLCHNDAHHPALIRGPQRCQGVSEDGLRIHQRRTLPVNAIRTNTDRAQRQGNGDGNACRYRW